MSRGFGKVQRLILDELAQLPPGYGVIVAGETRSHSSSLRRAAWSLSDAGAVVLSVRLLESRHRLMAFRPARESSPKADD